MADPTPPVSELPPLSPEQREHIALNRRAWDDRVQVHWESAMYQKHLAALRDGRHDLEPAIVEGVRNAVGDVAGKSLVHLQCHMGMETLGWAMLGARATGVDFSQPAIDKATALRDELGLTDQATFHCADVYDAPRVCNQTYDIVFVSVGSLCWLPDVERWAEVVHELLSPGGVLYLNDVHPLMNTLDDSPEAPGFKLHYPYLGGQPQVYEAEGTYAQTDAAFTHNQMADYTHSLGDTIGALLRVGLALDRFEESADCCWPALDVMEQVAPERWELPEPWRNKLPASFTLVAHRPEL